MAEACRTCNGVGYGIIDPDVGWRSGSPRGTPPIPCPDCQGRFAAYAKDPVATSVVDMKKTKRVKEPTYGPYVAPRIAPSGLGIEVVGGGDASRLATDEYDPGVVNTGSEKVSIEEALSSTAGEG